MAQSLSEIQQLIYHPNYIPTDPHSEPKTNEIIEKLVQALIPKYSKLDPLQKHHIDQQIIALQKKGENYLKDLSHLAQQVKNHRYQKRFAGLLRWQERYERLEEYPDIDIEVHQDIQDKIDYVAELISDLILFNSTSMRYLGLCHKKIIIKSKDLDFEGSNVPLLVKYLNDNCILKIFGALPHNTQIKKIAINYSLLLNNNVEHFIQALKMNTSIREICITEITKHIQNEKTATDSMERLFKALSHCRNVIHISFYDSFIPEQFSMTLAKLIKENNTLSALTLGEDCICPSVAFKNITDALINHPTISEFYSVFTFSLELCKNLSQTSLSNSSIVTPRLDEEVIKYTTLYCHDLAKLIRSKKLKKLYLSTACYSRVESKNTQEFVKILCDAFTENSSIEELNLIDSHFFWNPGGVTFFKMLAQQNIGIKHLKHVDTLEHYYDLPFSKTETKLIEEALRVNPISTLHLKWSGRMSPKFFLHLFTRLIDTKNKLAELYLNFDIFYSTFYTQSLNADLSQHKTLKVLDIKAIGEDLDCIPLLQSLENNTSLVKLSLTKNLARDADQDNLSWLKIQNNNLDNLFQNNVSLVTINPPLKIFEPMLKRNRENYYKVIANITQNIEFWLELIFNCSKKQSHIVIIMQYLAYDVHWQPMTKKLLNQNEKQRATPTPVTFAYKPKQNLNNSRTSIQASHIHFARIQSDKTCCVLM